ncbi:MAG: cytochrome b/b6 domain-containing protein [Flavobacteriales bacterium]|jgi:cytochrome b561|nr:cytochrome b/b6 domain-containing protein [Flavobacteriales bacterium]MBK6884137.1 cytochrome b/b6 domain-containing protein [Flavobacteriales bacterium]MBK8707373.1 cytochrome b/b6 domain-containing protein [Flavobacteriales bacterium]MBP9176728.1 cytochrome b/b6 domain-containing protein [Flavobacteriales bacterium]HQW06260.1 cytochrome b/b6 domain-containing protein [Flavobacteriales bacterium]
MEKRSYPAVYRIVHWAIAVSFVLLIITIFLRSTWMNKYNVAAIIQDQLANTEQHVSEDQAIALAKMIRQPMWDWHIYTGYVLTGLFALRFMLPVFGRMKFQDPMEKGLSRIAKFRMWTYLIFYVLVMVSLVTGLLIVWGPKEWKEPLEQVHLLGIYYVLAFIAVHLAGVLKAEFTDGKGIVSRIVSGSDNTEQ